MKTIISAGTDGSAIIKTGDIETVLPRDHRGPRAVGDLHDQIIRQRDILGSLPKCWQLVDVFLTQECPIVPGMKLVVVEAEDDREIIVDEVGLSHLTVAERVEEDGGFWENIQPEDCADSPQAARALRIAKAEAKNETP